MCAFQGGRSSERQTEGRRRPRSACLSVAQTIAKDHRYELKAELHHKKKKMASRRSTSSTSGADILVWGELIVYTTPAEATASLSQVKEIDEQFVRLIQMADNGQLRMMLEGAVEHCERQAALYIRVDLTCPIYWVRWDEDRSKADLDIVCDIPRRGDREALLKKVPLSPDGSGGVRLRLVRNKPSATSPGRKGALFVSAGSGRIVGSQKFHHRSSAADEGKPTTDEAEA